MKILNPAICLWPVDCVQQLLTCDTIVMKYIGVVSCSLVHVQLREKNDKNNMRILQAALRRILFILPYFFFTWASTLVFHRLRLGYSSDTDFSSKKSSDGGALGHLKAGNICLFTSSSLRTVC